MEEDSDLTLEEIFATIAEVRGVDFSPLAPDEFTAKMFGDWAGISTQRARDLLNKLKKDGVVEELEKKKYDPETNRPVTIWRATNLSLP